MEGMAKTLYARHVEARLRDALGYFPVVLLQGPRQCGKTTLVQVIGKQLGYEYRSFDDKDAREFAETDPKGFIQTLPDRVILDEAQKVPRLFSTIKMSVDNNRVPGRFILTGSVTVLQVREITDSLTGRMANIRLHPLSQSEISGNLPKFLDAMFSSSFKRTQNVSNEKQIIKRIMTGGYPSPLRLAKSAERTHWYKNYIENMVQHDAPDISRIQSPKVLSDMLSLVSSQTAQLLSANNLAQSFPISRPTIQNYLDLLEMIFMISRVRAWHSNQRVRLVKTPKLHISDTGLACNLLNLDIKALEQDRDLLGHIFETFVFQELLRQASGHEKHHDFYHYRENSEKEAEVDIVIKRGAADLVGVEVKAAESINSADFRGLRRFRDAAGKNFKGGVLLYMGKISRPFDEKEKLYALPVQALWDTDLYV